MIPENKKEELRKIVADYLVKHRLVPKEMRVNIVLTFVPNKSVVTIVDETANYDPDVLGLNAIDSFNEFYAKCNKKFTRVANMLEDIFSLLGRPATILDVVSKGDECKNRHEVDNYWFRYRNCGRKSVAIIDEWLKSLNLHRGMKL